MDGFLQKFSTNNTGRPSVSAIIDDIYELTVKCKNTFLASTKQSGGVFHDGFRFHKSGVEKKGITYYRCAQKRKTGCQTTLNTDRKGQIHVNNVEHNHPIPERVHTKLTGKKIYHKNFAFYRHSIVQLGGAVRWRCCTKRCKAILLTDAEACDVLSTRNEHSTECMTKNEIK